MRLSRTTLCTLILLPLASSTTTTQTIHPSILTTTSNQTPSPTPIPELKREVVANAGATLGDITQVSPTTTLDGALYIQLFSAIPDQWPSPSVGSIGLGTIQGAVGITRTNEKRLAEVTPLGGGAVLRRGF